MSRPLAATGKHCQVLHHIDRISSESLNDWGAQADCLEGQSHSRGVLLHKGPDNKPEVGFWECTPGRWSLEIPRDEFCHFIQGEASYLSDCGERIEVSAGTCVHFKAGWRGECTVKKTIRNVYMLTA